jgi:hypothetical protein
MAPDHDETMLHGMRATAKEPGLDGLPRCCACGDVIGVYERLVHVARGRARHTSRAAEPSSCRSGETCFHLRCYLPPVHELAD